MIWKGANAVAPSPVGRAEYMLITPEMAAKWLEQHSNYRTLSLSRAKLLAADITAGNWHVNGESIKFKEDGSMSDGQHRCKAIVLANKPIYSLVTWVDDVMGVDRGLSRSFSNLLRNMGVSNVSLMQGTTKILRSWLELGEVPSALPFRTDDQMLEFYDSLDADLLQYCSKLAHNFSTQKMCTPSSWTAAMYVFHTADFEKAKAFSYGAMTGESLSIDSPLLTLRNRLIVAYGASTTRRSLKSRALLAFVVKAWNAFYENRSLRVIKFLDTEQFPVVAGHPELYSRHYPRSVAKPS